MLSFYAEKLAYIHGLNCAWIKHLTSNDDWDLSLEIKRTVSSLINLRHIWISEQNELEPISEIDDVLPQFAWLELELENGRAISDYLERSRQFDSFNEIALFLLLKNNLEMLGQLNYVVNQQKLPTLPTNLFPIV